MNIPNLSQIKVVDEKGNMHEDLHNFLSQIVIALQQNLSNEGFKIPQQPTTNITQLNTAKSIGAVLYDNATHELKVNINGTFKVVQVI